ncbi:hypothetical protein VNO77_18962 [Canavalia gladiata]|uniref:Uncharacterized protein n=1 Tax=Canavalia gladiata TaxID=3824 RepID=A0AAN9LLN9_CANGL
MGTAWSFSTKAEILEVKADHRGMHQSMMLVASITAYSRAVEVHAFLFFPPRCMAEIEVRILTCGAGRASLFLGNLCTTNWYRVTQLVRNGDAYQRSSCALITSYEGS